MSPGDIAFQIGNLSIYYYGIIMALSIFMGAGIAKEITRKYYKELNPDIIYNISPSIIIGAILGARIYYCILCYDFYSHNIADIFKIWHGGLSIHGAIIGGLIAGIIYSKKHNLPILKLCDIFSYGLVLGQALGRWGNFFNSEAFGRPTSYFLKLFIPINKRPLEYMNYQYFHPTFLYESILDIIIFLILFFIIRKLAKGKNGTVFFSYLILYSIVRLFVEQLRIDSVLNLFGVPIAQIVSIVIILISLVCIVKIHKKA